MNQKRLSIKELNLFGLITISVDLGESGVFLKTRYVKESNIEDAQKCESCIVKDALSGRILYAGSSFDRINNIGLIIGTDIMSLAEFVKLIEDQFKE